MREVRRVKPEHRNPASAQFITDSIGVLIVVVGDDQDCVGHVHTSGIVVKLKRGGEREPRSPLSTLTLL
jgi:hypothetical protein